MEMGRSWVNCPKHGMQNCAMRYGIDQRCSMCVSEMLGRINESVVPAPMKRPSSKIFGIRYKREAF